MMEVQDSFRLACPHCGQHLEVDSDMAGMVVECPACGQSLIVPPDEAEQNETANTSESRSRFVQRDLASAGTDSTPQPKPVIKVVRKTRGRRMDKFKNHAKGVGIGLAVLLFFVGVGVLMEFQSEGESVPDRPDNAAAVYATKKAVEASLKCLENYLETQTDRRLQALSSSLETCPADFIEAVRNFLASWSKTSDDMISEKERNDATAATIILSLLAGAASDNAWDGMSRGAQIGGAIEGEVQQRAQSRLEQEIKSRYVDVIDVARKYGVEVND